MSAEEREPGSPADLDETAELLPGPGPSTVVDEIRHVDFPVVRRGYDREAVDAYIARVTQLVAELDATRSPQHAVKRALERVGEETASILRQAQQTAQEMIARSETRAREREQQAEREARRMKAEAQAEVRRLDEDTDRIWEERQRLIEDTRKLADLMLRVADDAEERFPSEPVDAEHQPPAGDAVDQPPAGDAVGEPPAGDSLDQPRAQPRAGDAVGGPPAGDPERRTEDSTDEVPGAGGPAYQDARNVGPAQAPSEDGLAPRDPALPPGSPSPGSPPAA
jgi:DivIVA domain-containing protein